MHLTTVISFVIALLGAVVLAIWMPGRQPGAPEARPEPQAIQPAETAGAER
jgi:hypothetical protein